MPYKDKEKQRLYLKEYDKQRFKRMRDKILLGKVCIRCGFDDIRALEFHHRDPSTKLFPVMRSLTKNWNDLVAEIEKCDSLCANCHAIEHSATWHE